MKNKGGLRPPRFLTIALAAVIAGSGVTDAFCLYDMMNMNLKSYAVSENGENGQGESDEQKQVKKERENEAKAKQAVAQAGNVVFNPAILKNVQDSTVNNQDDAFKLLRSVSSELGIQDVDKEYKYVDSKDTVNGIYYTFQQIHDNINVLGGKIIVKTNRNGNVLDISGHHFDVPINASTKAKVDNSVMENAIKFLMKKDYGLSDDKYRLQNYGLKMTETGNGDYKLYNTYGITLNGSDSLYMFTAVNAENGKIEGTKTYVDKIVPDNKKATAVTVKKKIEDVNPQYYVDNEERSVMRNDEKNLQVYKLKEKNKVLDIDTMSELDVYEWNPKRSKPDTIALDTLDNLEKTYDFFRYKFLRKGIKNNDEPIKAYVKATDFYDGKDKMKVSDNAAIRANGDIIIGDKAEGTLSDPEQMGYLFAQGIIFNDTSLKDRTFDDPAKQEKSEQSALSEGIAQIFGELVEDYTSDNKLDGNCDWENANGKLSEPGVTYDKFEEFKTDKYDAASLITYPVFKIQESKKVTNDQIADILYESLNQLDEYTDFKEYRAIIEKSAAEMNRAAYDSGFTDDSKKLDDDALESVIDSFDLAGIPTSFDKTLVSGGTIKVYGKDNKVYENYNIKLSRLFEKNNTVIDQNVSGAEFQIPAEVHNGIYNVTITDSADENVKNTFTMVLNNNDQNQKVDSYPDKCNVYTEFGSSPRDVVLVLDVSGSMSGEPIEQTRKAADKFIETILDESPSTRISVVTYSYSASTLIEYSNDKLKLKESVTRLGDYGNTNMYDGIKTADDLLSKSNTDKKMIVVMSDGYPNEGENDNGNYEEPIKRLATSVKNKDITIYSLGFFHNIDGDDKKKCQALMQSIATQGYYYELGSSDNYEFVLSDSDNELTKVFSDMADQINGGKYIYIRVACPVDVSVSYNGQTLSSSKNKLNTRTDFGTLFITSAAQEALADASASPQESSTYQTQTNNAWGTQQSSSAWGGQGTGNTWNTQQSSGTTAQKDDSVKILRLAADKVYDINIKGTGEGTMDYSISYPDEQGNYTDVRTFKSVPITKDTVASTNTEKKQEVDLQLDSDGDGKVDKTYSAGANETAKETTPFTPTMLAVIILSIVTFGLLVFEIVMIILRVRYNKKCLSCGASMSVSDAFCPECGAKSLKKNVFTGNTAEDKKPSSVAIIIKSSLIGVCIIATAVILVINQSPATTVYKNLRDGNTIMAQATYRKSVKGSGLSEGQAASLTNKYLDKANSEYQSGNYSYEDFRTLLNNADSIGNADISKKAKEYLKSSEEREAKKSEDENNSDENNSEKDNKSDSEDKKD